MLENLVRTLRHAGQEVHELGSPDGSTALILPHGGRVLGLFTPRSGENFLWTNPALAGVATARGLFESEGWHNPGGDRTWLAPELDFFLPDYPKLERYVQPRALDAGRYEIVETRPAGLTLTSVVHATLSRPKLEVAVRLTKEVGPAADPLRHERGLRLPGGELEYAGYTLRTTMEILGGAAGKAWVGAWSLLQLPHGGDLMIPTYGRTEPKVYFGSVGRDDLVVGDHGVVWRMRVQGEHKIGLRAAAVTGRAGYLYRAVDEGASAGIERNHGAGGRRWSLVVRNFPVNPSGEYVDVPWTDPGDFGYAVQACNVNSALGSFSELEHHAPAAGADPHERSPALSVEVSQVWAFRGSLEAIRLVAAILLGSDPPASLP